MNRNIFLAAILIFSFVLFSNAWASPAEIETAPKIQSIVLYPDSAMIKKEAVIALKKGENIIRISGLTANLTDESVQVNIKEKAAVRISDVKVEKTYLQKAHQEKIQKLQSRLESLNELIKTNTNEISAINNSIEFLKKIVPFPQNQKITPAEVEGHIKFLEKSLSDNHDRIAKIESRLKKLQEEKKALENEIKSLNSQQDKSKGIVITLLSPDDSKEISLVFSYVVTQAGWLPQYEARTDSNASKIDMDCFATIKQSTGEDWNGVNIEISTARPFVYGILPELSAWYVDMYKPRHVVYKKAMEEGPMMSMEKSANIEDEMPYEAPRIEAETTSFSFILPRKVDIPSDNQPHKILIASAGKEAKLEYYAAPKLSRYAYLKASLQNPFSFPLLSGNMNIFLDGKFVSTSSIEKTILPNETTNISLGVDEGIKIEKKLQNKFTEYAGVFSKDTKISYEYAIDITNGKGKEITLDLKDHFPVSRNEQIKVEIESPKKDEAKIADNGIILWNLKIAPHENKNLKVKFKVEYPKDLRITGLE